MEFRLYSDNLCANQIFVSSNRASDAQLGDERDGDVGDVCAVQRGQLLRRAFYSGDTNNQAVSGACAPSGATSAITPAQPLIATLATDATVGGSIGEHGERSPASVEPDSGDRRLEQ